MTTTETKYILHYRYYGETLRKHRQTYRKLESAVSDMAAYRNSYRRHYEKNEMWHHDRSGQVSESQLDEMIERNIYIEEQVITSKRLDF